MIQKQQFNTYKNEVDLNFLREYCIKHGEKRTMKRGETLENAGEPAKYVAYIEHGFFKYSERHRDETPGQVRVPHLFNSRRYSIFLTFSLSI